MRKTCTGADVPMRLTAALAAFERLHCRGAWYDFAHLIIKWLFIHQVVLLFWRGCAAVRVVAVLSCHLFSGQNESGSPFFFFFFCSFWHPTKLIASKGIGVEGLVLFWQFFQEWPSIRWSIVLERDLSLLNSWLAAKSRCYKGIESLQGTL